MKKSTVKLICVFLAAVVCCGFLGWMTSGFQSFDKDSVSDKFAREVNEDNLYTAESMTLEDRNMGDGIVVTVNKDGSFKVSGKVNGDEDVTFEIGSVTLDKGTYTLTALKGGSLATAYVSAVYGSEGMEVNADFSGNTFVIGTNGTTVKLGMTIKAGTEINTTVYPVIVAGEEAGDFYK